MEQDGGAQAPNSQSSNEYQGNTTGVNHIPSPNSPSNYSISRVAHPHDTTNNTERELWEPPNPTKLGLHYHGESFGICHSDVRHKEVIKLSIEF